MSTYTGRGNLLSVSGCVRLLVLCARATRFSIKFMSMVPGGLCTVTVFQLSSAYCLDLYNIGVVTGGLRFKLKLASGLLLGFSPIQSHRRTGDLLKGGAAQSAQGQFLHPISNPIEPDQVPRSALLAANKRTTLVQALTYVISGHIPNLPEIGAFVSDLTMNKSPTRTSPPPPVQAPHCNFHVISSSLSRRLFCTARHCLIATVRQWLTFRLNFSFRTL